MIASVAKTAFVIVLVSLVYSKCPANFDETPFGTCWYVQARYTVINEIALKRCYSLGAKLVTLETVRKITYLDRYLTQKGFERKNYWLGAHKVAGNWTWDGISVNTTFENGCQNWLDGEPNNIGGVEDCLEGWGQDFPGILWNDKQCSSRRHYICETDNDKCVGNPCGLGGSCSTVPNGERLCECMYGFMLDPVNNTCTAHPCFDDNPCGVNSKCELLSSGSVACVCKAGFIKVGKECLPANNVTTDMPQSLTTVSKAAASTLSQATTTTNNALTTSPPSSTGSTVSSTINASRAQSTTLYNPTSQITTTLGIKQSSKIATLPPSSIIPNATKPMTTSLTSEVPTTTPPTTSTIVTTLSTSTEFTVLTTTAPGVTLKTTQAIRSLPPKPLTTTRSTATTDTIVSTANPQINELTELMTTSLNHINSRSITPSPTQPPSTFSTKRKELNTSCSTGPSSTTQSAATFKLPPSITPTNLASFTTADSNSLSNPQITTVSTEPEVTTNLSTTTNQIATIMSTITQGSALQMHSTQPITSITTATTERTQTNVTETATPWTHTNQMTIVKLQSTTPTYSKMPSSMTTASGTTKIKASTTSQIIATPPTATTSPSASSTVITPSSTETPIVMLPETTSKSSTDLIVDPDTSKSSTLPTKSIKTSTQSIPQSTFVPSKTMGTTTATFRTTWSSSDQPTSTSMGSTANPTTTKLSQFATEKSGIVLSRCDFTKGPCGWDVQVITDSKEINDWSWDDLFNG